MRRIGVADFGLEPEKRLTHTSKAYRFRKDALQASGLIGPVWIGQVE